MGLRRPLYRPAALQRGHKITIMGIHFSPWGFPLLTELAGQSIFATMNRLE
jgi:hypothetical protein